MTWDRYCETIITIQDDEGWVDLNGPQAIQKLQAWLEARNIYLDHLHVLTAWNPGGRLQDRHDNDLWQRALCEDLWSKQLLTWPAFGTGVDGHFEDSVAVIGLSREEAVQIGRRYEQEAIFEVTEDEVIVLSCKKDSRLEKIPRLT
jgi:hypothetical protein